MASFPYSPFFRSSPFPLLSIISFWIGLQPGGYFLHLSLYVLCVTVQVLLIYPFSCFRDKDPWFRVYGLP